MWIESDFGYFPIDPLAPFIGRRERGYITASCGRAQAAWAKGVEYTPLPWAEYQAMLDKPGDDYSYRIVSHLPVAA